MSTALLMKYIKLVVQESQARVPNQLLQTDDGDEDDGSTEDVNEFCGVGAVMGYAAPVSGQRKKHGSD